MPRPRTILLLAALGASALALAGSAGADTGPPKDAEPAPAATQADDALLAGAPRGYQQVRAGFTAAAGLQTRGFAVCPASKVVVGGGAVIAGTDLEANINSSFPLGNGWTVDVNNAGGLTTFTVTAICMRKPKGYEIQRFLDAPLPPLTQNFALATCSPGKVVLGGGALVGSGNTAVNLNSTFPVGGGEGEWRTDVNNPTSGSFTFDTFVICAKKPRGYTVAFGSNVENRSLTQTSAFVGCPGTKVPLSGGAISPDGGNAVSVNSLRAEPHGWTVFENNASPIGATLQAKVVCAGA